MKNNGVKELAKKLNKILSCVRLKNVQSVRIEPMYDELGWKFCCEILIKNKYGGLVIRVPDTFNENHSEEIFIAKVLYCLYKAQLALQFSLINEKERHKFDELAEEDWSFTDA
jgi:hypothetical protein